MKALPCSQQPESCLWKPGSALRCGKKGARRLRRKGPSGRKPGCWLRGLEGEKVSLQGGWLRSRLGLSICTRPPLTPTQAVS